MIPIREIDYLVLRVGRSLIDLVPVDGKLGSVGGVAPEKVGHRLVDVQNATHQHWRGSQSINT